MKQLFRLLATNDWLLRTETNKTIQRVPRICLEIQNVTCSYELNRTAKAIRSEIMFPWNCNYIDTEKRTQR